jgi:hypothetical protein
MICSRTDFLSELKDVWQSVDVGINDTFEIEGPHGPGYLYITHCGIYLVSQKYGHVFSLLFDGVVRYGAKNNRFRIDWIKNNDKLYYEMKANQAQKILDAYQKRNTEHAESVSEIEGLIMRHVEKTNSIIFWNLHHCR